MIKPVIMLLSDRDLRALVNQMSFETAEHQRPFSPEDQIQPCTIDLRLDRCFWRTRKPVQRGAIDLHRAGLGELEMRRLFKTEWLHEGEGITVRPGEMLLGRTFEKWLSAKVADWSCRDTIGGVMVEAMNRAG
jgi:deoxycytidine triphosphate deaminase